jgi:hypothetical protein
MMKYQVIVKPPWDSLAPAPSRAHLQAHEDYLTMG